MMYIHVSARNLKDMNHSNRRHARTHLGKFLSAIVAVEAGRLFRLYRSVKGNKEYWHQRANAPIREGDFVYLAIGDSVANGIGASSPQKGYVGLIAQHIHETTSRAVHVVNVSVTGATAADVIRDQLPQIKKLSPDLVTLDVGANDVNEGMPEDIFMLRFTTILDALPAHKTIVANLPNFKRGPQQSTLTRLNDAMHEQIVAHHFTMALVFEITSATVRDVRTYAADFFHPSDKGHRNWFRAFEPHVDSLLTSMTSEKVPLIEP